MIRSFKASIFGIFSILIALLQTCENGITYDYQVMPPQPYEYTHMDLALTLEPGQNLVRGVVSYDVIPKQDGITDLTLDMSESAVDGIAINGEAASYSIGENSIIVDLPDSTRRGEGFRVSVTWQANSPFGLYKDHDGSFWSSKNPLAHRHWLPGFNHPRNELSFNAEFIIPLDADILFNGTRLSSEAHSETRKKVVYSSETEVPFTGLGFAMGAFEMTETSGGSNMIRLFSDSTILSTEERDQLLQTAAVTKTAVEDYLGTAYPWEDMNVVVLADNLWEERTHGTGTIFLYQNLGSLSAQLKRGIYAQWFGEYHRQEQYFDLSGYLDYTRTALHFSIEDETALIENPDSLLGIYEWNIWQEGFRKEDQLVQSVVKNSLPELIAQPSGIQAFSSYPEKWYEETGIPFNNLSYPDYSEPVLQTSDTQYPDTEYAMDAIYDEQSSELLLIFNLRRGTGDELNTLRMVAHEFSDSVSREISFTGVMDTVSVTLSRGVEYLAFEGITISMDQILIDEYPLFLLTNQLRSPDPLQRKRAALLLANYTGNPDVQLALNDILSFETNPEVRSAILSTMALFTRGASGTEQRFLDNLRSEDAALQITALQGLVNYPDNEMVISGVRNVILRTASDSVFTQAVETYTELADSEEIASLAQSLRRADNSGMRALKYMELTSDLDTEGVYSDLAQDYLDPGNPYATRRLAFAVIQSMNAGQIDKKAIITEMLSDRDPRIRFLSLELIAGQRPVEALRMLNSAEEGEYDARILFRIQELRKSISES